MVSQSFVNTNQCRFHLAHLKYFNSEIFHGPSTVNQLAMGSTGETAGWFTNQRTKAEQQTLKSTEATA